MFSLIIFSVFRTSENASFATNSKSWGLFKNHKQFSALFLKWCFHFKKMKRNSSFQIHFRDCSKLFAFYSKACLPLSGITSKIDRTSALKKKKKSTRTENWFPNHSLSLIYSHSLNSFSQSRFKIRLFIFSFSAFLAI